MLSRWYWNLLCLIMLTTCGLLSAGCEHYSLSPTDETKGKVISIFSTDQNDMPVDISFDNEGSLFQGRLYRDNKYYHVFDGEKYIAVSPFTGEMYSIENPLDELNIGDTVTVDRDISFTVDKIEYDSAWEDFYSPESGIFMEFMSIGNTPAV